MCRRLSPAWWGFQFNIGTCRAKHASRDMMSLFTVACSGFWKFCDFVSMITGVNCHVDKNLRESIKHTLD